MVNLDFPKNGLAKDIMVGMLKISPISTCICNGSSNGLAKETMTVRYDSVIRFKP